MQCKCKYKSDAHQVQVLKLKSITKSSLHKQKF